MQVNYEFSKGVHMRIEGTVRNRQDNMTRNTYNKTDPQNKHRLGTVSKKIIGGLKQDRIRGNDENVFAFIPHQLRLSTSVAYVSGSRTGDTNIGGFQYRCVANM